MVRAASLIVGSALLLALAGCGSSGGAKPGGTAASSAGAAASSPQVAKLVALIKSTAAQQYVVSGRLVVTGATCKPAGGHTYTCQMRYDFTDPNGQRVELETTHPASCSATCSVNWGAGPNANIIAHLGMDPNSPVAKCERALTASIKAFTSQAADERARVACKHVHHGIYTP